MLSDRTIKTLKPKEKEILRADYDGLYLRIAPLAQGGVKSWRFRFGKTSKSLGRYGDVSLADARAEVIEIRKKLAKGENPFEKKEKELTRASDFINAYAILKKLDKGTVPFKVVYRNVMRLTAILGDRLPHDYSKLDIHKFNASRLDTGITTTALRRELNSICAVFNLVYEMHEIDHLHRFRKIKIDNEKEDSKDRQDFSSDQLTTLREIVAGSDNVREKIIGLLIDTGMRCGEAVGLASSDVRLGKIPHLVIHKNPMRRLKNKNSQRIIPLVGTSLAAAQCLDLSNEWVFPNYLKIERGKDSASSAVNKRLRAVLGSGSPTSHSFRHTLKTRLRNVECPEYMQDELGGWAKSVSNNYGTPTDIKNKAKYIERSLDWVTEVLD